MYICFRGMLTVYVYVEHGFFHPVIILLLLFYGVLCPTHCIAVNAFLLRPTLGPLMGIPSVKICQDI